MTSEQNIEGALLLDDVPLKRGHYCFAFFDRKAEATGGQIFEALLDLKLETLAPRDFVPTLNTDFPAHPASPLPRLAEFKPASASNAPQVVERSLDAVRNAIELQWSNGQAEGQINRLKTLKRAMYGYGRAGPNLLRARMLPLHHTN
jgi:hypothetical protein